MSKLHYVTNNFSKIAKRWGPLPSMPLKPFNIDDLNLRYLAKLWCFKLIMTKSNFKN